MSLWQSLVAAVAALNPWRGAFAIRRLECGVTTAAAVRERLGPPGGEWRNADGSVTWEYSRQPNGSECFMLSFVDGILRDVEQALRPENLARVAPGMTREQVRRLFGRPRSTMRFPLKGEEVWDWKVGATLSQTDVYFNVHFSADGRVVGTSRSEQTLA